MKVRITQEHIDKGKRGSTTRCPIALGLEAIGCKGIDIIIGQAQFGLPDKDDDGRSYCCERLPAKAQRFVERFDEGLPVKPFNFKLDPLPFL